MITQEDFRATLGCFPSGVTVITTQAQSALPVGVTVSSFCSVSLEPPLILFCLNRNSNIYQTITEEERFIVNILSASQENLAEHFAKRGPISVPPEWLKYSNTGMPFLKNTVATIECNRTTHTQGGDHDIILGTVTALHYQAALSPLLRFRSHYTQISEKNRDTSQKPTVSPAAGTVGSPS